MQNEDSFNGWMFINFVATQFYYQLYRDLKAKELINKISPRDILLSLDNVRCVKSTSHTWTTAELSGKTRKLLEKLKWQPIT